MGRAPLPRSRPHRSPQARAGCPRPPRRSPPCAWPGSMRTARPALGAAASPSDERRTPRRRRQAAHGLPEALGYGIYVGEIVAPVLIVLGAWSRLAAVVYAGPMGLRGLCTAVCLLMSAGSVRAQGGGAPAYQ